jgi:hypothetical protein
MRNVCKNFEKKYMYGISLLENLGVDGRRQYSSEANKV